MMAQPFWTTLGLLALALALALGAIGVVLPLLPTTPFVILAAFFFSKGAPRLAKMLEDHRVFGPILAEWRAHGVIAPKYKATALGMMLAALCASFALGAGLWILLIQAVCMGGAACFILSRPSRVG